MMEAKDTLIDSRINGLEVDQQLLVNQMFEVQAAITWDIAYKAGRESLAKAIGPIAYDVGKQAGMKEVVELIDKTGLIEHTDNPLHEMGATILGCPACCWYAFLKERGIR